MSASATALDRGVRFFEASLGKKVIMAVTGLILFGFVMGHLIGNLQIYLPANAEGMYPIDSYALHLRALGPLLWIVRGILLLSVVLHFVTAFQLSARNRAARPQAYAKTSFVTADFASRHMVLTGLVIAAFVVYHIMDLTLGVAHSGTFEHLQVHANMISGFANPLVVASYVAAMAFLGFHLSHGVWSMFQSVGLNHPRYMPLIRKFALVVAILIVVGNISIPLAVHLGLIP